LDTLGNTGDHSSNIVGKLGGDVTIHNLGNSGDGSINEIGLLNLHKKRHVQKINLDTLTNTGDHSTNIVGKKGGDVTIKSLGNSGDGSINEIGLLNL